jgi:hypothetical protein
MKRITQRRGQEVNQIKSDRKRINNENTRNKRRKWKGMSKRKVADACLAAHAGLLDVSV